MCDYCDCRSIPEVAALWSDHERIGDLLGRLRRDDRASVDAVLDELTDLLASHSVREEHGIYASLARTEIGADYVGRFFDEHGEIDAAFARARTDPDALDEAIELLATHIDNEEHDMFPAARQVLAPEDWAAIDRDLTAMSLPSARDLRP